MKRSKKLKGVALSLVFVMLLSLMRLNVYGASGTTGDIEQDGQNYTTAFQITYQWSEGYNADITITNTVTKIFITGC